MFNYNKIELTAYRWNNWISHDYDCFLIYFDKLDLFKTKIVLRHIWKLHSFIFKFKLKFHIQINSPKHTHRNMFVNTTGTNQNKYTDIIVYFLYKQSVLPTSPRYLQSHCVTDSMYYTYCLILNIGGFSCFFINLKYNLFVLLVFISVKLLYFTYRIK